MILLIGCIEMIGMGLGDNISDMSISHIFGVGSEKYVQGTFAIHGPEPF